MRLRSGTKLAPVALVGMTLLLAACGSSVNSGSSASPSAAPSSAAASESASAAESSPAAVACGNWGIAMHAWVGYTASAQVLTEAAKDLGCTITQTTLDEAATTYDAMEAGSVDVVVEDWGGGRWQEWVDRGAIKEVGPNGNVGLIGMYVPQWMCDKYPDINDSKNLNKYADLFKTSESGSQGQLLDGDPSFVTNDEALVKNLDLNYKVVYAGSETALIQAFRQSEKNKTPILGYFYEPQWFLAELPLVKVDLPESTEGCDADPATVACDYPEYELNKIVSTKFAESGSPAYDLIKNFQWTNEDQNTVAQYITEDKMTPDEAAEKWVSENPDKVEAWLS